MLPLCRKYVQVALIIGWTIYVTQSTLAITAEPVRVNVRQGILKGKIMTSAKGRNFYAFQGIPYAKPPIGNLRFLAPQRPAQWKGELDATNPGPYCIQVSKGNSVIGSEDCLYLNVFTTYLPKQNGRLSKQDGRLLHVMFWIHGGGFYAGSGVNNPPQYLMDKNVVYVSINYRLGALGFLSTEDDESPGNYGLKDQTAALEWVHENIAAFGGNPNSVTIFGESAGSMSVHYHILSKLSRGFFHRAISMSGTATSPAINCSNPLRTAQYHAKLVNCTISNTSALVDCLRQTDAVTLTLAYHIVNYVIEDLFYVPCPENRTSRNPKPFLPAQPSAILHTGDFNKVPWIVGTTSQELAPYVAALVNNEILNKQVNQDFEYYCKKILFLSPSLTDEEAHYIYQKFVEFYLNGDAVFSQRNAYQLIEGFTDRNFVYPVKEAVDLQYSKGQNKIFWYNFAYRGLYSVTSETTLRNYGVAHSDDVRYLFPVHKEWPYTSNDREVVELMVSLWTNFAKFGNPTPPTKPSDPPSRLNVNWLAVQDFGSDSLHMRYYNIGQVVLGTPNNFLNQNLGPVKLNMAVDLHKKGMTFWESLNLKED